MAGRHCSKQEVEGVCIFHSKHEAEGSRNDVRLSGMRGKVLFSFIMCGCFACMPVGAPHAFGAQGGQKKPLEPRPRTGIRDS